MSLYNNLSSSSKSPDCDLGTPFRDHVCSAFKLERQLIRFFEQEASRGRQFDLSLKTKLSPKRIQFLVEDKLYRLNLEQLQAVMAAKEMGGILSALDALEKTVKEVKAPEKKPQDQKTRKSQDEWPKVVMTIPRGYESVDELIAKRPEFEALGWNKTSLEVFAENKLVRSKLIKDILFLKKADLNTLFEKQNGIGT